MVVIANIISILSVWVPSRARFYAASPTFKKLPRDTMK
jgi:hypothetical protein